MMLVDFHSHTTRCGHAVGTMEEYVERALALGISEFGFSDHSPWMIQTLNEPMAMRWPEVDEYVRDVRRMQERYNRTGAHPFTIRLGMEMDYVPSRLDAARELIKRHEWDYLIGSVHNIGMWGVNDLFDVAVYDRYGLDNICEGYFHLIGEMVKERYCDVIGHLDLPKRFGHRPAGGYLPWIEPLIPAIKAAGIAVEINTSGKDYPAGEFFPSWDVVEALAASGVALTLGGDSHAPEHVGRHFGEVLAGLRQRGIREVVRFEKRQAIAVNIDDEADKAGNHRAGLALGTAQAS